jgi:hypothetical protein
VWTSKGLGFRFLNEIAFMLPMMSLNLIGGLQDAFMEVLMCFVRAFAALRMHIWEHPKNRRCMSDVPLILLVLHDVNSCQASLQMFICRDRLKQCFGYKSATILHAGKDSHPGVFAL